MSLVALARAAAVSASMLSAVERGEKAPTVMVLSRIADGLDLPLSVLLGLAEPSTATLLRASDQPVIIEPEGWRRTILTPMITGVSFEWIEVELPAGVAPAAYDAYAPGSHEFVHVLSGELLVDLEHESFRLGDGDTLHFRADTVHRYRNESKEPCVYAVAAIIARARHARNSRAPD
jgi:XRE family transcriptional regulator, regulator of sulfur utilization